ncbi:Phosphoadenosine phosphosulfate reductase family protein [Epsilonproteobacteria bacterium SCGC AD-308-P11]|mgnify:CR=1 FL=1|nr:Phosphoadenosine phosphosulfate reductase family protein [Epsilonproteobacteria bacterium SCGC AD-308-P11]
MPILGDVMSALLKNDINFLEVLMQEKTILKEQIKSLYLKDNRVLSLGFSGGKDSSATLTITLEALLEIPKDKLNKTLYILYSDTLMELLPVQAHTYKVLDNIRKFAKENDLPIEVMHSKPSLENTKWSMKLAKGMRVESQDNRWCTTRLKTNVQEEMLFKTFGTKDIETISIVGSRKDESTDRAKRLTNNTLDGHLKSHIAYPKSLVFAPIEDYTTEDVWITLRTSKIGRDVLVAEELYALYASTNGEGEECQTILGNAGDNGLKPNCSNSQGRFGCWECGLQHGRDKALVGMQKDYPYIKHLIEFRNWSVSTRDGQWEEYRDVYNHKNFTHLQYNFDNHRFGMSGPGGMNLKARKTGLDKLLFTEQKVNESIDFRLISDEELDFIQHRWILEGDFELTAMKIAEQYGRKIKLSEDDINLVAYAKVFYQSKWIWDSKVSYWYNIHANERFAIQFVKQIKEKFSFEKSKEIINKIYKTMDATIVPEYLKDMQLKNQFYPSVSMERLIRREWKEDKVSFVTQALIHDYEETWEEAIEIRDPLYDENVSMEDKYAILDNWNDYVGEDTNEKFVHPEYMRFGGNFQYIQFRERQSEENKSKKKLKKEKRLIRLSKAPKIVQHSFDFAA